MSKSSLLIPVRARAALASARALRQKLSGDDGKLRAGAFATLGAVVVGAGLLAANVAHERKASLAAAAAAVAPAPVVAAAPIAPAPAKPAAAEARPDAIAVLTTPAPTPVAQKSTARIDMTPTGAIAEPASPKPKHKPHHKKAKLDSAQ